MLDLEKKDVCIYIEEVKKAIREGRYQVSSRDKNEELFLEYIISETERERILLGLCVEDFCEAVPNDHPAYSEEILYVFGKEVELMPRFGGDIETVPLYIKFNKLDNRYVIVISFHEQEYPMKYKFK